MAEKWISTEHEGAPNNDYNVLVLTGEPNDLNTMYAVGYYAARWDKWVVQGWAGTQVFMGVKGVPYWQPLTLPR